MKKFYILLIALFIVSGTRGQGCLPEGITFSTQAQIDSFHINYPGCTEIEGDVVILEDSSGAIRNLYGLLVLTSIGGDLFISGNDHLTHLAGLGNLSSIGGSLSIYGNNYLKTIESLGGLTSVGGNLNIGILAGGWGGNYPWGNPSLSGLEGLEGITSLAGLGIIGNHKLTDLTGLNNLINISGGLSISYNDLLSNLTGLDNLTYTGGLFISSNDSLSSLTGLDNLSHIGGDVHFGYGDDDGTHDNPALVNLNGLESLTKIAGTLRFIGNGPASLEGLNNLDTIGGDLIMWYADLITSMEGLDNLNAIGGKFLLGAYPGTAGIHWIPGGNSSLESFSGLNNLTSVGGDLLISTNDALTSLSGLENVTSIEGDLIIYSNDELTTLAGLENVNSDAIGNLSIYSNPSLSICEAQGICTYLAGPNGIVDIYNNAEGCNDPPQVADGCGITLPCLPYGNYRFRSQADIDNFTADYPDCFTLEGQSSIAGPDINNLEGLSELTSIGGSLKIGDFNARNPALTSLTGLENLSSIGGDLEISYDDSLTTIAALAGLRYIGGELEIRANPFLTSLSGLDNIDSIGGSLRIGGTGIENMAGLSRLKTIGGHFGIHGYEANLTSLDGLDNLTTIGGGLFISHTEKLNDLSGLIHVNSINGNIIMQLNNSLTSLTGMENIDAGSIFDINISYNYSLSECAVKSICEYLAIPNVDGTVFIYGNAGGCNTQEGVMAECLTEVPEQSAVSNQRSAVSCYPNPTPGSMQFAVRSSQDEYMTLKVYDVQGREVAVVLDEKMPAGEHTVRWDAGKLPAGIYFYRLTTDDYRLTTGKVVVVR